MSTEKPADSKTIGEVEEELADLRERMDDIRLEVAQLKADYQALVDDVEELDGNE